ncbi:MAG TPA: CDP-alcohol phosphatidyltransferase family protein [Rhizomicrobium sp.]|nr:CDP-alcohol phosphatidyltransferase family protein [Rhizomicrobium sp.]
MTLSMGPVLRNIPNALSAYRLGMAPVVAGLALTGREKLFVLLIVISLISDILDGLIARAFRLQTAFGAKLDSIADDATYIAAFIGVLVFKAAEIGPHMPLLYLFMAMVVLTSLVHLVKFGRFPSFHLYSFRVGGYLQGGFLVFLFVHGFEVHLFYFVFLYGIAACLEVILVTLVVRQPISNARGLYWVLRDRHGMG